MTTKEFDELARLVEGGDATPRARREFVAHAKKESCGMELIPKKPRSFA